MLTANSNCCSGWRESIGRYIVIYSGKKHDNNKLKAAERAEEVKCHCMQATGPKEEL